jgi:hypothetical protein
MTEGSRIVLFLAVLAGAFGLPNAAAAEPAASGYVAVIDAGSSGSRLTLYADDPESLVPIIVTGVDRATKGLSSFAETPALAGPGAITPLLEELGSYLADQGIQKTDVPVALLATAGLRNVRADDRAAAQAILASGRTAIAESGYRVADARILPAVQEATLAWLDANALRDTVESKRRSVGIIEIGGASAQVAFRSPTAEGRAVQIVRVDGKEIPVVGVSYLGLGGNDVRSLMQDANDAGSFCFPNNASGQEPTIYLRAADRPVAADTARFNWKRCAQAFEQTILEVGDVRTAAAPVAPSGIRQLSGFTTSNFLGIGRIPLVFADLKITDAAEKRTALRQAVRGACDGTNAWPKVTALFEGRSTAFADTLCPSGVSQYEFLFGQGGLAVDSERLLLQESSGSRAPAWSSGYAITVLDP